MTSRIVLALVTSVILPASAQAEESVALSLSEAFRYADEHSPWVVEGRTDVAVAAAVVEQASVSTADDPELGMAAGPRFGTTTTPNVEVTVGQKYELSRRRAAEIELAKRQRAVAELDADAVRRTLLGAVGEAYVDALHARRRLRVAQSDVSIAETALRIAKKRFEAGETDQLEVNTAKVAHGRARVEERLWAGRLRQRRARLQALLGVPERTGLKLTSTLELPGLPKLAVLREASRHRPDLAALEASVKREEARRALAETLSHSNLGWRLKYGREEGANIVMAGLSMSVPVYDRGRGVGAEADARAEVARASLEVARTRIDARLPAAWHRWRELRDAEVAFRNDILPVLDENEAMARKAYTAGAIDLPELLALRREMVAARERYVDLLRESAMVQIEARTLAGTYGDEGENQ